MWEGLALGGLEVHDLPGGHLDMMRPPMVETLAGLVRERIEAAESERRRKRAPVVESFPVAAAR
jgi:thioesterase domain-containing protein